MGKRAENDHRARAWLAWHSGTLAHWKKIPSLGEFMRVRKTGQRMPKQSPEILLAQMKAMHVAFGGDPEDFKKVH